MNLPLEEYLGHKRLLGRAEATLDNLGRYLRRFHQWMGEKDLRDLTRRDVEAYQDDLLRSAYEERSRKGHTIALKGYLHWLHEADYLLSDLSMQIATGKHGKPRLRMPPTEEQVSHLLESIQPVGDQSTRDRALLELIYASGMRRGEVVRLRLTDVDWQKRHIRIQGKTRIIRVNPLGDTAFHYLELYLQIRPSSKSESLFVRQSGAPFTKSDINRTFLRVKKIAGFPVFPHLLRHAFAVHLLRNGCDIRVLQVLMGHTTLDMTAQYLNLVKDDIKRAYDDAMDGVL